MSNRTLRTEGLAYPSEHPLAEDITEVNDRLWDVQETARQSGTVGPYVLQDNDEFIYEAFNNNAYDLLYYWLLFYGEYTFEAVSIAVTSTREDGRKNTAVKPTEEKLAAINTAVVALKALGSEYTEDVVTGLSRLLLDHPDEEEAFKEVVARGVQDPAEVAELLEEKRTKNGSISVGVL